MYILSVRLLCLKHVRCCFVLDIYVSCVSYSHQVAAKNFFVASVSTYVETSTPEKELQPGIDLLGPVEEK